VITQAIYDAITREIMRRRPMLDDSPDLGQVQITIKLNAGTQRAADVVRGIVWQEERVCRTR
jgi:hypothetical protein